MIDHCPHCQKQLALSEAQIAKVENALASLPQGKLLKLGCPHCQQPIELRGDGTTTTQSTAPGAKSAVTGAKKQTIDPPKPPDLSWLESGQFEEKEIIQDVPMALILMQDGPERGVISESLSSAGYLPVFPNSAEDAIDRMQFGNFGAVVLHSGFEAGGLAKGTFHAHMRAMAMSRRRSIMYILVGPELTTLYDLEALAHSANLVVNDRDAKRFNLLYKKAAQDNALFFGPLIETMNELGRHA